MESHQVIGSTLHLSPNPITQYAKENFQTEINQHKQQKQSEKATRKGITYV